LSGDGEPGFRRETELEAHEAGRIMQFLERRYEIRLPEVEVRYSENINHAFCVSATEFPFLNPPGIRSHFVEKMNSKLRLKGLKDEELEGVSASKFTIFMPRIYLNHPSKTRGALWHELGHATANSLNVKSNVLQESIAIACQFTGLLLESQDGEFPLEEALDHIELDVKTAHGPLSFLFHYREAFAAIRLYNSDLRFRNRNVDELLVELDKSIQYAVNTDREIRRRELSKLERPFVTIFGTAATVLLLVSVALSLL